MRENSKSGALTETTFFVLLSVYTPNHGYGIMQFVDQETQGRVVMGPGTLYGAINTLLKKEWIMPYGENDTDRKKEYIITPEGKAIMEKELERLQKMQKLAHKVMGGTAEYDM